MTELVCPHFSEQCPSPGSNGHWEKVHWLQSLDSNYCILRATENGHDFPSTIIYIDSNHTFMFVHVSVFSSVGLSAWTYMESAAAQVPAGAASSCQPPLSGHRHGASSVPRRPASGGCAPWPAGCCPVSPPQASLSAGYVRLPDGCGAYWGDTTSTTRPWDLPTLLTITITALADKQTISCAYFSLQNKSSSDNNFHYQIIFFGLFIKLKIRAACTAFLLKTSKNKGIEKLNTDYKSRLGSPWVSTVILNIMEMYASDKLLLTSATLCWEWCYT